MVMLKLRMLSSEFRFGCGSVSMGCSATFVYGQLSIPEPLLAYSHD